MATTTTAAAHPRPSDARRQQLQCALSCREPSDFLPLERYYELADKVLAKFQTEVTAARNNDPNDDDEPLDRAYVYGKRYCTFVLNFISQHKDYGKESDRKSLQVQHEENVDRVLRQLSEIVDEMDVQEVKKQRQRDEAEMLVLQQRASNLVKKQVAEASPSGSVQASVVAHKLELLLEQPREEAAAPNPPPNVPTPNVSHSFTENVQGNGGTAELQMFSSASTTDADAGVLADAELPPGMAESDLLDEETAAPPSLLVDTRCRAAPPIDPIPDCNEVVDNTSFHLESGGSSSETHKDDVTLGSDRPHHTVESTAPAVEPERYVMRDPVATSNQNLLGLLCCFRRR